MTSNCPFCGLILNKDPKLTEVKGIGVYHLEPLNPVVPGHRIFIHYDHFARPEEYNEVTGLLFGTAATWGGAMGEDYNLIVNAGPAASQTVPHVHVHYVPRREGDGLLMPWTGQVPTAKAKVACPNCGSSSTTDYLYPGTDQYAFSTCNVCEEDFEDPTQADEDEE